MTDKDVNNRLPDTVDALQRIMYEALAVIERKNAELDMFMAEQRAMNETIKSKNKQLARRRAEIERLMLEVENKQYTILCASQEIADLRELLDEVRAENEHKGKLKAALAAERGG